MNIKLRAIVRQDITAVETVMSVQKNELKSMEKLLKVKLSEIASIEEGQQSLFATNNDVTLGILNEQVENIKTEILEYKKLLENGRKTVRNLKAKEKRLTDKITANNEEQTRLF